MVLDEGGGVILKSNELDLGLRRAGYEYILNDGEESNKRVCVTTILLLSFGARPSPRLRYVNYTLNDKY